MHLNYNILLSRRLDNRAQVSGGRNQPSVMELPGTVIENGHALEQKDWSPGIEANCLVSATLAVTEKEAGAQPSLHSEVDVND